MLRIRHLEKKNYGKPIKTHKKLNYYKQKIENFESISNKKKYSETLLQPARPNAAHNYSGIKQHS